MFVDQVLEKREKQVGEGFVVVVIVVIQIEHVCKKT